MALPEINDADQMLALLRKAPARRIVIYGDTVEPFIVETLGDTITADGTLVAKIADIGTARDMMDAAQDADINRDFAAWSTLPLRYGPGCSTWVLPAHPRAPSEPGPPPDPRPLDPARFGPIPNEVPRFNLLAAPVPMTLAEVESIDAKVDMIMARVPARFADADATWLMDVVEVNEAQRTFARAMLGHAFRAGTSFESNGAAESALLHMPADFPGLWRLLECLVMEAPLDHAERIRVATALDIFDGVHLAAWTRQFD